MSFPAHLKYIVLSILFVLATVNFTKTTLTILESSKRLDTVKNDLTQLEAKKAQLKADLSYRKTNAFIEEEARNKLNMAKPGEEVFIFPQLRRGEVAGASTTTTVNVQPSTPHIVTSDTYFNQWFELLF